MRQIVENALEFDEPKYILAIELKKAFDRIPRKKIWKALKNEHYGIEWRLRNNIKAMYEICISTVRTQSGNGKWFDVNTGVRQESVLSPLLFILYIDKVTRILEEYESSMIYADDTAIIKDSEEGVQQLAIHWNEALKQSA